MTNGPEQVTAAMILIGNELLSGRTIDKNLAYLAPKLNDLGIQLIEARVIPDIEETIIKTVNELRAKCDYVFTTGGIGPTHDDITAECVAKAFDVDLEIHAEARAILAKHYEDRGDELTEARLLMARIPVGGTLIHNSVSAAPGFMIGNVLVMAGVPSVMQSMFENAKTMIKGGTPVKSTTVAAYLMESKLANPLAVIQDRYPNVDIGSYPFFRDGTLGCNIVCRSTDEGIMHDAAAEVAEAMRSLGAEPVFEEI